MSSIIFHSEHIDVAVRGSERFLMGSILSDTFKAALGLSKYSDNKWVLDYIEKTDRNSYLFSKSSHSGDSLDTWLSLPEHGHKFIFDGKPVELFSIVLSTAIALGGDELKLMARLHGQCEIHCWIEPANHAWFAGIIEKALAKHILRAEQGWETVIALLRKGIESAIVCSYSVCEQFPNAHTAGWKEPTENSETWYDLTDTERWEKAMVGLRSQSEKYILTNEIKPETWDNYSFACAVTAFTLKHDVWTKSLAKQAAEKATK